MTDHTDVRDEFLSTPEMSLASGATYRMIDHWCRVGIIAPSREANGSGSQRRWHVGMIPAIRVAGLLMRLGVAHEEIRRITDDIAERGPGGSIEPYPGVIVSLVEAGRHAPPGAIAPGVSSPVGGGRPRVSA